MWERNPLRFYLRCLVLTIPSRRRRHPRDCVSWPGKTRTVDGEMDQHRMDRVGLLSPLEESSAEISRDSGIVSQSTSSLSMVSELLSSGTVSQSPSFGAAANVPQSPSLSHREEPGTTEPEFTEQDEEILRQTALGYSSYIRVTAGEEVCVPHRC